MRLSKNTLSNILSISSSSSVSKPIVWAISASDCSAHAGAQADLATFNSLDIHGCTALTAVTAQNSQAMKAVFPQTAEQLSEQIKALQEDLLPNAIKIGLLPNPEIITQVSALIGELKVPVILDPVLKSSTDGELASKEIEAALLTLLPHVDLFTPNLDETARLLNKESLEDNGIKEAADQFHALGAKGVLIKGGHGKHDSHCRDYLSIKEDDGTWTRSWLVQPKLKVSNSRGTGCTLSSAIAGFVAKGERLRDAVVLANAYVHAGLLSGQQMGSGPGPIGHQGQPINMELFPQVCDALSTVDSTAFPDCGVHPLGLYPVVDTVEWLEKLLPLGVDTAQIRIKDCPADELDRHIKRAIQVGKQYNCRLFINDYWELAIKHGAYGVHLGQEDIETADLNALRDAGIRLGISTHGDYEWARAASHKPSYLAIGAIFPTDTKDVHVVGIERLTRWTQLLKGHYPLTAIGGINFENLDSVLATGMDSVAVVSAVTKATDFKQAVEGFQKALKTAI